MKSITVKKKVRLRRQKLSAGETMFLALWLLYQVTYILMVQSEYRYIIPSASSVFNRLQLPIIAALFCKILFFDNKLNYRIIWSVVVFLLVFISARNCGNYHILTACAFALGYKGVDTRRFITLDIWIKIVLIVFVIGSCLLGIIPNYTIVTGAGEVEKAAFGFYHPNVLGNYALAALLEWLYLNYKKFTWRHSVIYLGVIALLYSVCRARTAIYSAVLILVLMLCIKLFPGLSVKRKFVRFLLVISAPLCAAASFFAGYFYRSSSAVWAALDSLLTTRIRMMHYFLSNDGISLLGQSIEIVGSREARTVGTVSIILDNSYVKLGIMYGVVVLALICIFYSRFNHTLLLRDNYALLLLSCYYIFLGIAENYFFIPAFNITFVLIFTFEGNVRKQVAGSFKRKIGFRFSRR